LRSHGCEIERRGGAASAGSADRRLARIGARCLASARRYRRDGYLRRPLRNLLCLSLYLAGVPAARIVRLYG